MEIGNLHDMTLEEMIHSNRYWDIINKLETTFEPGVDCKGTCRQDAAYIFLDEYVNDRPSGINFI